MPRRPSDDEGPSSSASGQRDQAGAALRQGSRFADYVIRELIGAGGMARVYRAEHETLGRDVALKVLRPGALPGREARERFLLEARITAGLQHSNVVQVFDVGVHEQLPYLAMELLQGEDLDARLHSEGALEEAALIEIALPLAAALAAVHAAGVVHRDLKPGNVFLARSSDGEVIPKLVDFGISKAKKQDFRLTLAPGERLLGTALYMAPEVLLGGEATPASDQYSLGVILYECVTGVNPFVAPSLRESVRRIATGKRRRAIDQVIAPSPALAALIERALQVEPARRFSDLQALGRELLPLAGPRTRATWELKFPEPDPRSQPPAELGLRPSSLPPSQRSGALTALAALGWITAAALGVWQFRQWSSTEDSAARVRGPVTAVRSETRALRAAPATPSPASHAVEVSEARPRDRIPGVRLREGVLVVAPNEGASNAREPVTFPHAAVPHAAVPHAALSHAALSHAAVPSPSESAPDPALDPVPATSGPTWPAHRTLPAWASRFRLPDAGTPNDPDDVESLSPPAPGLGTNAAPIFD